MRDLLGEAHEAEVSAQERHGRGQYFTPFPLIELVLDLCEEAARVVDPACGSGRFLMAARERWPGARLSGWDTDPAALRLARSNLPDAALHEGSFLERSGEADLLLGNPPYVRRRGSKVDLYVEFLLAAPRWLRPGGRVAFVLSSAWLDVGYGAVVREALAAHFAVEWIVEGAAERWFPGAKVNTMVLVARREEDAQVRAAQEVRFGVVRTPLPAQPEVVRALAQGELDAGRPLGPWLRAPSWWLERWRSPEGVVRLDALAAIQRGYTTNDNRFFYPPPDSGIEARYLRPLLKSPREVRGVRGVAGELNTQVFLGPEEREQAPGARAWIGERAEWRLIPQQPTRQLLVKGYGDRFRQPRFDAPVHYDQQLYGVYPVEGVHGEALAGLMHSSWFGLTLELLGRVNFGDGVLWLGLKDARALPVPDLRGQPGLQTALAAAFSALPEGQVPTVAQRVDGAWAEELGRIDALVEAALGVQAGESLAAWGELCARRLRKAARGERGESPAR